MYICTQSQVSKRSWVLQECLNRSTTDYITTRNLLEYGLTRTSFRCFSTLIHLPSPLHLLSSPSSFPLLTSPLPPSPIFFYSSHLFPSSPSHLFHSPFPLLTSHISPLPPPSPPCVNSLSPLLFLSPPPYTFFPYWPLFYPLPYSLSSSLIYTSPPPPFLSSPLLPPLYIYRFLF